MKNPQEYKEDDRARCSTCCMSRIQRMGYKEGCPMNFPKVGCPFYDNQKIADAMLAEREK